ncbi:hypothetical protein PVAP13_9KG231900 [Panicum virgatum]|uniref:Uncharacterized protein n=1 Tax=Panicum virgatum TaxID=38727 RepID=A0A8T0NU42_PANVG|nr:hypothetical protein PVAP13_9KG231900 [Panicum virgatum]
MRLPRAETRAGCTRAPVGPSPRVGESVGGAGRWVEPNNNTKLGDTAKACVDLALISSPSPAPPIIPPPHKLLPSTRRRPPPPPPIRSALTSDQFNLAGGRTASRSSAGKQRAAPPPPATAGDKVGPVGES